MFSQFGKNFIFGTATAAYQIEGGWNEDGKGLSIWDKFAHTPGKIRDGSSGDLACNTYHDFQTDIEIMKSLTMDAYRFSISWSRLMPEGRGAVNQKGLDYYDRLVDTLLEKGIRPFVTLFHWDTPYALYEKYKGFAGRETANYFAEYALLAAQKFGDRVKDWITLNEPWEHAMMGHFLGEHAPGLKNPWTYFKVAHHQLLGHGLAVQAMRSARRDLNIGVTLSQFPVYPASFEPSQKEMDSVEMADMFINRFYLDGVFKGKYPEKLFARLWPIVPKILQGDMATIQQPVDFLGVNYYSRLFAERKWYIPFLKTWIDRSNSDERYAHPVLGVHGYPEGFKELAKRYREEYGNPAVYITENGTVGGEISDKNRIRYLTHYLSSLREAIDEGSDIRGYFYWSLLDNFEWNSGLACRMGLIHVDHATQQRTIRESGFWLRDLIANQESRR
ncbi:GH1 family beta-glucosidase [Paenibacillus sp. JDR-2]|uniref:GH1 family beta-glucosidase n=1 Tax=Paenibacillus sp. (strain JDR-2) TaxID=324057 RepID=UPI0001AAF81E|nr:GH1 family beta-glucosidase [Paenibacillus sp. JDR-2]ACT01488.1 beta-galactosidase [Paenibacillus sp. JDR-2]